MLSVGLLSAGSYLRLLLASGKGTVANSMLFAPAVPCSASIKLIRALHIILAQFALESFVYQQPWHASSFHTLLFSFRLCAFSSPPPLPVPFSRPTHKAREHISVSISQRERDCRKQYAILASFKSKCYFKLSTGERRKKR